MIEPNTGILYALMMLMKMTRLVCLTVVVISVISCKAQPVRDPTKGLKDFYAEHFSIGVSVSPRNLSNQGEAELIKKHFNSITAENAMKFGKLQPKEGEYFWRDADSIVAFAERHGMKIRGHTLVWHQEAPSWLFLNERGDTVSKSVLLDRLKRHITTVVSRYKGRIYAWDVVNEAISNTKGEFLRNTAFQRICGEEYIAKAFEYAHAADPSAMLFYNDYNEIIPEKREKIFRLVSKLRAKGVPVHALGLQAHWSVNAPSKQQLEETLAYLAKLKLPIQITELDVSVYPKIYNKKDKEDKDTSRVFTSAREAAQLKVYKEVFSVFRKYRQLITGVTFWNVSDKHSWLDNFPVKGRKDYPLLFNEDLQPKEAYWKVVDFER